MTMEIAGRRLDRPAGAGRIAAFRHAFERLRQSSRGDVAELGESEVRDLGYPPRLDVYAGLPTPSLGVAFGLMAVATLFLGLAAVDLWQHL